LTKKAGFGILVPEDGNCNKMAVPGAFFNLSIVLLDHNGIAGAATMLSPFVSKSMMRVIAIVSDFPSLI
jgi:hypothetical protein